MNEMANTTIPVQITVKLRNAKMVEARKRLGYSQFTLAEIAGVSMNLIGRLEKFELPDSLFQYCSDDKLVTLAAILGLEVDEIAPPSLCGRSIRHTVRAVEHVESEKLLTMAGPQQRYILPSPADVAERNETSEMIRKAIGSLTFREREVLKYRFGLDGKRPLTYEETGQVFNVTRERVRQVEMKGLRKVGEETKKRERAAQSQQTAREESDRELREWEATQ